MQRIKIGVVGLGGIGGLIAILFKRKRYEVFSNKNTKEKFISMKLSSTYYGNLAETIQIDKTLGKADIIFICSKFPYLKKNLNNINNKKALVISFLNGLSHFDILKNKFSNNKTYISNIGKVVSKKNQKKIAHASNNKPEVLLSSQNKNKDKIKFIYNLLKKINFKVKIVNSNTDVIWNKLIRLSAVSAITSLYNCNFGQIKKSKKRSSELEDLVKEGLYLAKTLFNYSKNYVSTMKEINRFPNNLSTSMQRDINSKIYTKSEIKTQIGAIYKLAVINNIELTATNRIYKLLIKKCQKKY